MKRWAVSLVLLADDPIYRKVTGSEARRIPLFQQRSQATADVVGRVLDEMETAERGHRKGGRPFVMLAWAQSLDGSLALESGRKALLSGAESQALTHALRASQDAILVGIDTLLADDPELTVRHWPGRSPAPVVLDSHLRTPPTARLLAGRRDTPVRIACTSAADERRIAPLTERGAQILRLPAWPNGWVDLQALLRALAEAGVNRLMVEGGAKVLTSFLRAELGDHAVVTLAPRLLGGLPAVGALDRERLPHFVTVTNHRLADDLVFSGALRWGTA